MGLKIRKDMKRNTFISMMMVLVTLMGTQSVMAQEHTQRVDMNTGLVVWTGSTAEQVASSGEFFYLVQWKDQLNVNDKEQYVGARGDYGVQAVMSPVGMRMQLVTSNPAPIRLTSGWNQPSQPSGSYYQFVTRILNADSQTSYLGDRLSPDQDDNSGASIYLDRSNKRNMYNNSTCNNFPNWKLVKSTSTKNNIRYKGESTSHSVDVTTYIFQNVESQDGNNGSTNNYRPMYITVNSSGRLVTTFTERQATKFIIVSESDFNDAMGDVTWGEVDLGVFVQDASFGRDNKDGIYWEWETNGEGGPAATNSNGMTLDGRQLTGNNIHWHQRNQDLMCNGIMLNTNSITPAQVGRNVAGNGDGTISHDAFRKNYGEYYSAEIYNEVNSLTQELRGATIPNLVDGLYKLTAQALYDDDVSHNTNNGVAYFVVRREVENEDGTITVTEEEMPIKPILNDDLGSSITRHSGVSAGYVFNNNPNAYLLTTFVEINGKTNLTIGIKQKVAKGWTVVGNVHLYAHGKQALLVDEDWEKTMTIKYMVGDNEETTTGDPYTTAKWYDNYDYPATVYYQRTFAVDKWNTICLPLSLTGRQVRQAFGNDAKVCAFIGQKDNDPNGCILFSRALDLDKDENMDKYVIRAGIPYIIYVSKFPQHPDGMSVEVGNGNTNELNHTLEIEGASYSIPGVIKDQYTEWQETVNGKVVLKDPIDVHPDGTDLHFVGSFYHKVINKSTIHGSANANGSNDYWVITKGDMYHLTGGRDWNIWATYAYLYRPYNGGNAPAKELSFAIDDGYGIREIATHIEGLYFDKGDNIEDNEVYNLSGTKVGKGTLDTLPKGIYILNGRKYVKK